MTEAKNSTDNLVDMDELKKIVREALHDEFAAMGLVADSSEAAAELQRDFAYLRSWRQLVQKGGTKVLVTTMSLITTGLFVSILMALGVPGKVIGWFTGSFGN